MNVNIKTVKTEALAADDHSAKRFRLYKLADAIRPYWTLVTSLILWDGGIATRNPSNETKAVVPAVLRLEKDPRLRLRINVDGTFDFNTAIANLEETRAQIRFVLRMSNENGVTFESVEAAVPMNGHEFTASGFRLASKHTQPYGPCKVSGNWKWEIVMITRSGGEGIDCYQSTIQSRLEFYFVLGGLGRPFCYDIMHLGFLPLETVVALSRGPLFGWDDASVVRPLIGAGLQTAELLRCNNPFWRGDTLNGVPHDVINFPDNIKNEDPMRRTFATHIWVEVLLKRPNGDDEWGVCDATQATYHPNGTTSLEAGSRSRRQYFADHIDSGLYHPQGFNLDYERHMTGRFSSFHRSQFFVR
ncbi:hypothetical protein ABW21_db0207951 [Orbilia brochopaga]|nr:hypothetical protein ABW21_db0207951 [Drechslerella brochopaga]